MRRLVLVLALLFPAAAHAETATVSMPGKSFSPGRLTIVAGDSVLWRNGDLVAHDVKGPDFTSGPLANSGFFTHPFGAVGAQPFVCTIHPFMTGEVDVVSATLSGASAYAGEPVELKGRAPAGTASAPPPARARRRRSR
jgi:plastocyanin